MGIWQRLFGKDTSKAQQPRALRDIPAGAMSTVQTLRCDPTETDPERRFSIGKWGLKVADDEDSQRLAKGVLKRSAGKSLRLEPHPEAGHRGVISSAKSGPEGGYSWLYVDVDLRTGIIKFSQGGSDGWQAMQAE